MRIRFIRKKHRTAVVADAYGTPPELFDPAYYRQFNDDVRENGMDPWKHYCDYGWRENRDPNPIFRMHYYRDKYMKGLDHLDPLRHYIESDDPLQSTHPLFDASFYASQLDELPQNTTLLEHFLAFNCADRKSPSPFFDSAAYLDTYEDIAQSKMNPLYHYLRFGKREERKSFIDPKHIPLVRYRDPNEIEFLSMFLGSEIEFTLRLLQMDPEMPTVVCVSHEASLTGAPLIILKVAESMRRNYGVNIVNLLCRDGGIRDRFESIGPTFSLDGAAPYSNPAHYKNNIRAFVRFLDLVNPVGVFMNSAESRHVLSDLAELQVPMHSLIHENARCYYKFQDKPFHDIAKFSERVIFPSAYVQESATQFGEISEDQSAIVPQGLLREELLDEPDLEGASDVRKEFDIPADATLIIGCGTGDGRKGLDLFMTTAISLINKNPDMNVYFGWIGDLTVTNNVSPSFWAHCDVEVTGLQDRIVFFGPQQDVANFFNACDIFYLTSRIDPFPCVVNEAMACGKPIVLFDGGSGCVDLVTSHGGAIVPYADICAACDTLGELVEDHEKQMAAGKRNRDYVKENMKFDDYVAKLYDSLADDMQKPHFATFEHPIARERMQAKKGTRSQKCVFFLAPCWSVSGINTFTETLGCELNKLGFESSIIFTTQDQQTLPAEYLPKIPYYTLGARWTKRPERRKKLASFLKSMEPAVVIPNCDYASSSLAQEAGPRTRYLGILHSDDAEHYVHGYRMGQYWDGIVSVSNTIESRLLEMNPSFKDKSHVIRYGIQLPQSELTSVNRLSGMYKLRLIYTGRLAQQQKRILDFVGLMGELDNRNVPFEMTFVGEGPDQDEFEKAAAAWIERGAVRLTGRLTQAEIVEELYQHNVFSLLSDFEGLPLSLLEALACECIPVVTQVESGISEVLTHNQNALTSPLRNVEAMADNLQQLFQSNDLRATLTDGLKPTLQNYRLSASDMASQYAEVLDRIFFDIEKGMDRRSAISCPHVEQLLDAA